MKVKSQVFSELDIKKVKYHFQKRPDMKYQVISELDIGGRETCFVSFSK